MKSKIESSESSYMYTAEPSTSRDSLFTSKEGRADVNEIIIISSEASVSQEDDFSQLKTKNTERSKRARRRISSDTSDNDSASQNRLRKASDSQYSSEDYQEDDHTRNENSNVKTAKPRTSSDSVYSSGEDIVGIANPIITISSTVTSQGTSQQDDFSQLKIKNTERNRRARRYIASGSSDDDKPSQKSSRKPSDSQHSSKDCQKNKHSKRYKSNDSHASEKRYSSQPSKKNKKIKKEKQPPNKSSGNTNKTPIKRKLNDSLSKGDLSPPETRNLKRRKKGRQSSPVPIGQATTLRNKGKSPKKSKLRDAKPLEKNFDNFQEDRLSHTLFYNVIEKYTKKEVSSNSSSSDESDNSQIHTISDESRSQSKTENLSEASNDSQSQSSTTSLSEDGSHEFQDQPNRKRNGRRRARLLSSSSSEEASTSKRKNSNGKITSDSSSSDEEIDKLYIEEESSSQVESELSEGGSVSEGELDSKNNSFSKDESDIEISQVEKPVVSRKKYKKLRVVSDMSDDDTKEKKFVESPKKIKNIPLLKYKYNELMSKVTFGSYKDVQNIIFDGKTDELLALPEFSQLLWRVVKSNKINPATGSLLVRAGVNVNLNEAGEVSDSPENSMLHVVAEKAWREKYEQLALTLMNYGADINKINYDGNSILWSAVKGGSEVVIQELMRRKVEVGDEYNKILRLAAESPANVNPAKILPLLIEYKDADMETRDRRALYALRCLVKVDGDLNAMRVLLDYILPLNDLDDDGNTLLHRAVIDSKFEMVKLLLEYGANPRMKRKDGSPPLWFAAHLQTSAIAGLLIKHGASVNDSNSLGQYPIHKACNSVSLENIRLLLYYGAEINVPDTYYEWTPFAMVNHQNLTDVTKLIIQHLAFLKFKGIKLYDRDLQRIRNLSDFRIRFAKCSSELYRMKKFIVYEDISAYCIFNYDAKKMSHLIKNSELIDEYHKKKKKLQEDFPMYWPAIHKRMKIAWSRRDKLISTENAVREASNNVLTVDVCEKIALIACYDCLIDDEMKEVSSS